MTQELGRLGQRHRRELRPDPGGDRRCREPSDPRGDDHRRGGAGGVGDLPTHEDPHEEGQRASDGGEGVRHQQVGGGDETRDDGGCGRQVEAVHGQDRERTQVEGDPEPLRIEQDECHEERLDHRGDREDGPARPSVDEDAHERAEDREGEDRDQARLEQPHGRALVGGCEDDRGHEGRLEEAVPQLSGEADREEPAEVGGAQRVLRPRRGPGVRGGRHGGILGAAPRRTGASARDCGRSPSAADTSPVRTTVIAVGMTLVLGGVAPSTSLAGQPASDVHVSAYDHGFYDAFDPSLVVLARGGTVTFDFDGPDHHTATDGTGMDLYDSGVVDGGGPSFSYTYRAAGGIGSSARSTPR